MSDTLTAAKQLVAEALEVEVTEIEDESNLDNLEAWDSLAHMRVVQGLEEKLGGTLSAHDIVSIYGVSDVVEILGRGQAG